MSRSFLLQDWTTIRSSLNAAFVQDPSDWLDLDGFSDVVCWLDVMEVTPPGGLSRNSLRLSLQTAPCFEDAYFVPIAPATNIGTQAPFVQASTSPTIVRSAKSTVSNDLMRFLRWSISPSTSGAWDITFRVRAIAARSPTFVPPLITGCQNWFRSDLGVSIAVGTSNITTWTDQSGTNDANKNLTATGTPTLNVADALYMNQPTVSFSGVTQYFTSGSWVSSMSQPNTWIVVGHRANTTTQMDAMDGATSGFGQVIAGGAANNTAAFAGSTITTPTAAQYAWTSASVVLVEFNGSSSKIYMNDFTNAAVTGAAGAAGFDALSLGSHNPAFGASNFWNGTIAEVIAYGSLLTATQKAQLRQYFRGRYGIMVA